MKTSLVERGPVERLLLLAAALRSGLIDALADGEAKPAAQVAQAAGADERASGVMLEALTAEGVVERLPLGQGTVGPGGGTLYRLSRLGRVHLVDEGPELERSALLHRINKLRGWLELPEVIRTGTPAPRDPAKRDTRTLVSAMGERDPAVLDEIADRCLAWAGDIRTMIDVGGAVGHVARCFSRRGVKATLLDKEEVIPIAREFLGEEAAGIDLVAGDFTESLPAGPFDLVYFGNVFHIYGPDTNARVSEAAFAATSPGGVVAVQDYVWDRSPGAAMFAVNMLQATVDGGVWTEAEYRGWLSAAGFEDIEVLELEMVGSDLVLGRRRR